MSASTNVLSIACSRSGLAAASCSSTNRVRSILGLAAIASLLVSSSSQELVEDHAVAVSPHGATPVRRVVVHHVSGRKQRSSPVLSGKSTSRGHSSPADSFAVVSDVPPVEGGTRGGKGAVEGG